MNETITMALGVLGSGIAIVLSLTLIAVFVQRVGKYTQPKDGLPEAKRATIIARREFIARDDQDQPYTQYFVTFETGDGERVELEIPAAQYGYMVERDRGSLRYEEGRFISFDRK